MGDIFSHENVLTDLKLFNDCTDQAYFLAENSFSFTAMFEALIYGEAWEFSKASTYLKRSDFPYSSKTNSITTKETLCRKVLCDLDLRLLKKEIQNSSAEFLSNFMAPLIRISQYPYVSITCQAQTNYQLGLFALQESRISGELYFLWKDNCAFTGESQQLPNKKQKFSEIETFTKNITAARNYFLKAASLLGPSTSLLYRKVLRSLALVTGPTEIYGNIGMSSTVLLHSSIGYSARQSKLTTAATEKGIFHAFDIPLSSVDVRNREIENMMNSGHEIPVGWKFVAISICPTGELLIASLAPKKAESENIEWSDNIFCIFPETPNANGCGETQVHKDVINVFDDLINENDLQLSGKSSSILCENGDVEESKRQWWDKRIEFDNKLKEILRSAQAKYFCEPGLKDFFVNHQAPCIDLNKIYSEDSNDSDDSEDSILFSSNLAAKFEAVCAIEGKDSETSKAESIDEWRKIQSMTVVEIKRELGALGVAPKAFRGLRKADLIRLFFNEKDQLDKSKKNYNSPSKLKLENIPAPLNSPQSFTKIEDECTFLILDEHLHRFPWESMDMLMDSTVCRIPSIPFAIEALTKNNTNANKSIPMIDPNGSSFVLDPDSNLQNTQENLLPILQDLSSKNDWDWKSSVGVAPSQEFMLSALTRERGLLLYCGHGGGERFFSRQEIEKLSDTKSFNVRQKSNIEGPQALNQCRSSIILMGCSSGKLSSVNSSRKFESEKNIVHHYEPEGIALSYLCAGSPCVVSNLWDVTDRDIDRCVSKYSLNVFKNVLIFSD